MLSVQMNIWLTVTVSACVISLFSRAAIRAACNSSFGTVFTFIGATRAFPKTKASSVFSSPLGVFFRSQECYSTENILGTVTEHMQLYIIKGSTKITSRDIDVFKLC